MNRPDRFPSKDIRDIPAPDHSDILGLNFIRTPGIYHFRRHYRSGLRSHIMELLRPGDLRIERKGTLDKGGMRLFPRARPVRILRIFKRRFRSRKEIESELKRVKIISAYLGPDNVARSDEFLVSYLAGKRCEHVLCGLQEYVEGEILDPWAGLHDKMLKTLLLRMASEKAEAGEQSVDKRLFDAKQKAGVFIKKLKALVYEAGYVPDLAGMGNLLITRAGDIKLVDINNISRVDFSPRIAVDEKGYPVCDKSIQGLALLEEQLSGQIDKKEKIYEVYTASKRVKDARKLERRFHLSLDTSSYP